jgi:hypothetical protein
MDQQGKLIADMLEKIADDPGICGHAGICYGLSKLIDASGVDFGFSGYSFVFSMSGEYTTFNVIDDMFEEDNKWHGQRGEFRRAWCRKVAGWVRYWSDEHLHEVAAKG